MQHDDLKTATKEKFAASVVKGYKHFAFAGAVQNAYEVSSLGARGGNKQRSIVVTTVAHNAKDILMGNEPFTLTMDKAASFGKDLSLALRGNFPGSDKSQTS